MKSCHSGNRDFLRACAHTHVCAQAGACAQTRVHSRLRYSFSGKGLFPKASSKGEQKQGERAVLSHSQAVLLRSNLRDNRHRHRSPVFLQVLSGPSLVRGRIIPAAHGRVASQAAATAGAWGEATHALALLQRQRHQFGGGGWCLQSLGRSEGILIRHSRRHRDLPRLFC